MNTIAIHCLPTGAADARRLAACLAVPLHEIATHTFPDGELRVSAWPVSAVSIVYAPLDRPNDKLLALLFAAESLRRNGCTRLVLVAPYLCYMRQDTAFHPGEAISQKVIGQLIASSFDRVITVDAHLHRTARLSDVCPGIDADNLSAMPAIAKYLRADSFDPRTIIVGPDAELRAWVNELSTLLGVSCTVAKKTRLGDRSVEIALDDPKVLAGPARPAGRRHRFIRRHDEVLRASRHFGRRHLGRCDRHSRLVSARARGGIHQVGHPIRSLHHQRAACHGAIALDQLLSDALQSELAAARTEGMPS